MGKGNCGDKGDFKSSGGQCGGKAATGVTVMEAIGTVVNIGPACCICCILGCCGDGCCLCFFTLCGGIANLFGASFPTCCQKNAKALCNMAITSGISLVLRVIVAAVLGAEISEKNEDLDDFDKCMKELETDDFWNNAEYICANKYLDGLTRKSYVNIIRTLGTLLMITCIWLAVSMIGLWFGYRGSEAEKKAEKGVTDMTTSATSSGPPAVAIATTTQPTVQVVTASPAPPPSSKEMV